MNKRLVILKVLMVLLASLWAVYLFTVQIFDVFNLSYRRQIRYNPSKEITIPVRGNIYDRNGEMLASTIKYYQIDVDKTVVERNAKRRGIEPEILYDLIAKIISNNSSDERKSIIKKLNNKKAKSVMVSNSIKESELLKINEELKKEDLLNVIIPSFNSMKRIYSKGKLGARLLGMVKDIQDDTDAKNRAVYRMEGFCGIESSFNDYLAGEYGWKEALYDANNSIVSYPDLQEKQAKDGNSVYLTIDAEIQQIVEDNLWEGIKKYQALNAIAIVMNPKTGEILAMGSVARKDGNTNEAIIRSSANLAVTHRFEPGSTMKPFVSLLALDKKLYRTNDYIDCTAYHLGNRIIRDSHEMRSLTFEDVIVQSSNVGVAKIAERIGAIDLYNYYISLGFGNKTGSNIYGESAGTFKKYTNWSGFTLHSVSFGQEMTVNALQLTNAYCTIANGGNVLRPYILHEVKDSKSKTIAKTNTKIIRNISTEANIKTEKGYLKSVVERGTGSRAYLDYVSVGGKTGTAEKIQAGSNTYAKYSYTSVFSGFFPVEDPQYVITVAYDEPAYEYHFGSASAVPTFKKITEQIIALPSCKLIPNMKWEKQVMVKMPDIIGLSKTAALEKLSKEKIKYQIAEQEANGIVIDQYPKANVSFSSNEKAIIVIGNMAKPENNNDITKMPNLIGMSIRKAHAVAKNLKIELEISGSGIVVCQSITPGEPINYLQKCKVSAQ